MLGIPFSVGSGDPELEEVEPDVVEVPVPSSLLFPVRGGIHPKVEPLFTHIV